MSRLPRKKSRLINIDGRYFRWMLQGKSKYLGHSPPVITISIQEELDKPGSTLQCTVYSKQIEESRQEEYERYYSHKISIIPSDIKKIIKTGIEYGWNPDEKKPNVFKLKNIELNNYKG